MTDPRIQTAAEHLALAVNRSVALTRNHLTQDDALAQIEFAADLLADIDAQAPDATIARLQQTLVESYGGDATAWNLERGLQIVDELESIARLRREVVRAFVYQELDGGRAAAYTHPLYLQADQRAENLREELRGLI